MDPSSSVTVHLCGTILILYVEIVHLSNPLGLLWVNTCGDIYDNQGLCSFQTLRTKFCLPASAYFVFLQLRSALKAYGVPWSSSISSHPMRDWIAPSAGSAICFLCYQQFYFIFSHTTQHNIQNKQNKTADTYSTPQGSIKREGERKDNKNTKVTPLYSHVYSAKNIAKPQWLKAWPHRLAPLYIYMRQFAGGYGSNMPLYTCAV